MAGQVQTDCTGHEILFICGGDAVGLKLSLNTSRALGCSGLHV